jgi:hypothetical protein
MPAPHIRLALADVVAALAAAAPAAHAETRSLKLLSDGPFATDPATPAGFLYESADGSRVSYAPARARSSTSPTTRSPPTDRTART